ncbi:hypothetical protein BUALT_Bualt11G0097000 [Buddleja alternifolia]|uniref:Uncharacterized protein n=1 Tax=Buddleja alternifolia TaxID=168488 RepID=A0AAV6X072_9LAMI|nr:hypothetical protein BUALT_Bualt11G0097000 [Buddleja alternifolia]
MGSDVSPILSTMTGIIPDESHDWSGLDPFKSIWVEAPEDHTAFLQRPKNGVWVETEVLGGLAFFANFLCSHVRTDLPGQMRNSIYFPKVRFFGKRCVSYSFDNDNISP